MKISLLFLFIIPLTANSQKLPKKASETRYFFTDIPVKIENGHGDSVVVRFNASIPKNTWNKVLKNTKSEKDYFAFIATELSLKAQFLLKNRLSFEPLRSQFFAYKDGRYICDYKMMGRNEIGNMVETSDMVTYDPPLFKSEIHLNLDSLPKKVMLPQVDPVKLPGSHS